MNYVNMNSGFLIALLFFVLGKRTNDLHFHVYLLDGVVQWNEARSVAVDEGSPLQHHVNRLSQKFLGRKLVEEHNGLGEYTGNALHDFYVYVCLFKFFSAFLCVDIYHALYVY